MTSGEVTMDFVKSDLSELQDTYPKRGISLTLEQANAIFLKHLQVNCKILRYIDRGYNNLVCVAESESRNSYIIRIPGQYWRKWKTCSEVASHVFLTSAAPSVPLPKIHGFSCDAATSVIGVEYILMDYMPGAPLDIKWESFSDHVKQKILHQVAKIFIALKDSKFNKIGSIYLKSEVLDDKLSIKNIYDLGTEAVYIGQVMEQAIGPFDSYKNYITALIDAELDILNQCEFMKPQLENEPRIRRFVESIRNDEIILIHDASNDCKFFFHHGDFCFRNFMVNESGEITSILDFDFAGSFPPYLDWIDGFEPLGIKAKMSSSFGPNHLLEEKTSYGDIFLSIMDKLAPHLCPFSEHHQVRIDLAYFIGSICPWYLRNVTSGTVDDNDKSRERSISLVNKYLSSFGF